MVFCYICDNLLHGFFDNLQDQHHPFDYSLNTISHSHITYVKYVLSHIRKLFLISRYNGYSQQVVAIIHQRLCYSSTKTPDLIFRATPQRRSYYPSSTDEPTEACKTSKLTKTSQAGRDRIPI